MELLAGLLVGSQLVFTVVAGLYFYTNLKSQQNNKSAVKLESRREVENLKKLRGISLSEPLSEKTRPEDFEEIIGQEKAIRALKAALCGPNPQHVIIYGPPGVGKTAAARIVLGYAKNTPGTPFMKNAPFVEMDATILQFDERSIADPLTGSVHDPIYQGAGAYGPAGVPQPKPGAVTKAHGGVLFIDEIGELHNLQMNKLLKILEDRKVYLTSSYYSPEDDNVPKHIHDMFQNGLPADFRLVGATTRSPEDLPPALRSRCAEVFFRHLNSAEVKKIARNAFAKAGWDFEASVPDMIAEYSSNGRDTVNMAQTAISLTSLDRSSIIGIKEIEEVIEYGRYQKKPGKAPLSGGKIGVVNGLAVFGSGLGAILEIEAVAERCSLKGTGSFKVTGIIEEEEITSRTGKMRRPATARSAMENCLTALCRIGGVNTEDYFIHVNFPGGAPVDGPSAGAAVFAAVYSAVTGKTIPGEIAITGEITIKGRIAPVGGVASKIEAAAEAGLGKVIIPRSNYQDSFEKFGLEIVCAETIMDVLNTLFGNTHQDEMGAEIPVLPGTVMSAKGIPS